MAHGPFLNPSLGLAAYGTVAGTSGCMAFPVMSSFFPVGSCDRIQHNFTQNLRYARQPTRAPAKVCNLTAKEKWQTKVHPCLCVLSLNAGPRMKFIGI